MSNVKGNNPPISHRGGPNPRGKRWGLIYCYCHSDIAVEGPMTKGEAEKKKEELMADVPYLNWAQVIWSEDWEEMR